MQSVNEILNFEEVREFNKITKDKIINDLLANPISFLKCIDLSLYEFLKLFWSEVSEDKFKDNWHVKYICDEIEYVIERAAKNLPKEYDLIINIPPGMTKTLICSVMAPVWAWTRWYHLKFITGSYTDALALESAEKARDIIESDKFKSLYSHLILKEDKKSKSNYRIVHRERPNPEMYRLFNGGSRFSTSTKGTIMGFHAHVIIIDDPIDPRRAASEIELQTANNWLTQTLSTRKTDKEVTPTILIMQRLHQDDPSGHLLSNSNKKIKHICLPGEIINYRDKVRPVELVKKYKNNLLDESRLNLEALKGLEIDLGEFGYAGQIGQNPTPPGGGLFKVDHFQFVDKLPTSMHIIQTIRYWDKAALQGKGCYTAGVKMCRLTNNTCIVIDVKRGQWATEERERIIKETARADGENVIIWIEQEPGSGGKESADGTIRNLMGFIIQAEHPTGDKVVRARPYAVQVNNGNVALLKGDWNHAYVEECRYFPFGKYKDQIDASAGAFNKIAAKRLARRVT
jgi:predicted phage terminase large subunit-like protein